MSDLHALAEQIGTRLKARGETIAVSESSVGGLISAARSVSTVALLATSATRPASLLQLDFMVEGKYESAAVVGVLVVLMTTGTALVARFLGLRVGLHS